MVEALPSYANAKAWHRSCQGGDGGGGAALADAQRQALEALIKAAAEADDAPEPPDDTIEPEITETAPDPLFTSKDGFVEASRKLINKKRLAGLDDDADDLC